MEVKRSSKYGAGGDIYIGPTQVQCKYLIHTNIYLCIDCKFYNRHKRIISQPSRTTTKEFYMTTREFTGIKSSNNSTNHHITHIWSMNTWIRPKTKMKNVYLYQWQNHSTKIGNNSLTSSCSYARTRAHISCWPMRQECMACGRWSSASATGHCYMVSTVRQARSLSLSLYQPCRKRVRSAKYTLLKSLPGLTYIEIGNVIAKNEMLLKWAVISMYVHFTYHISLINKQLNKLLS
jgi:hypothetical protein